MFVLVCCRCCWSLCSCYCFFCAFGVVVAIVVGFLVRVVLVGLPVFGPFVLFLVLLLALPEY